MKIVILNKQNLIKSNFLDINMKGNKKKKNEPQQPSNENGDKQVYFIIEPNEFIKHYDDLITTVYIYIFFNIKIYYYELSYKNLLKFYLHFLFIYLYSFFIININSNHIIESNKCYFCYCFCYYFCNDCCCFLNCLG